MEVIVPLIMVLIVSVALIKRVNIFDAFVGGARDGLKTVYTIAPALIGLIVSVGMLKASGALELLCDALSPVTEYLGFPSQVLPMAVLRPVSGSASTALLSEILKDNGADSFVGRCASVMAGSSETTFYAITLYYSAAKVKHIRHTLFAALMADFCAAVLSVLTVRIFFT